jgi:hypothetical protein
MENLTRDVIDTLDFMTEEFGPTTIRNLAITPIPGGFGQGFPGLVYLSTLAYLDPGQLPPRLRDRGEETFFADLLEAHEVAHQWWGNMVVPVSYHDDWLIEALANYSALLLLERRKGKKPWTPFWTTTAITCCRSPQAAARSNPRDRLSGDTGWNLHLLRMPGAP